MVGDGDYAPGTFKAVPLNIKDLFSEEHLGNIDTMTALIQCDFKPYESRHNIFSGSALKKINNFVDKRKFESIEQLKENIKLDVNQASHELIFSSRDWRIFYNTIEGEFTDPDFPPEKDSVVGHGFDGGEPRDPQA